MPGLRARCSSLPAGMGLIPCRLLPCAISRRTTNFPRGPGQGRWWCLQEASWVRTSAVARTAVLELQLQPSNSSFEKIPAPPGKRSLHAHALGRAPTGFRYLQFGPQLRRQCFLLPSSPCQGLPTLKEPGQGSPWGPRDLAPAGSWRWGPAQI